MNLSDKVLHSKEIIRQAVLEYQPKALVIMFSGGDDSLAAYHVFKHLGYTPDYVIHGRTGTGIRETHDFAVSEIEVHKDNLIIADAGTAYEDYVLRKGFFGKGIQAHQFSYHILKSTHFSRVVGQYIRKRRRNYPILFINGARRQESANREKLYKDPIKISPQQKNNIWVNIINEWTDQDCKDFLKQESIKRNPVSVNLCRSGECMCGTVQSSGSYQEAKACYPEWGKWMDDLRERVLKRFPWDWGESIKTSHLQERQGQTNMFQPMCVGCTKDIDY